MGQHINMVLSKGRTDTHPQQHLNSNRFHVISWEQCVFINCLCLRGKKIINQKNSQPDLSWEISQNEKHRAHTFPPHETRSVTHCERGHPAPTCQRAQSSQSAARLQILPALRSSCLPARVFKMLGSSFPHSTRGGFIMHPVFSHRFLRPRRLQRAPGTAAHKGSQRDPGVESDIFQA